MTKQSPNDVTQKIKFALEKEPGLTVKDLVARVGVNRQFMVGFLAALEERAEISCRKVGPARIYFTHTEEEVVR